MKTLNNPTISDSPLNVLQSSEWQKRLGKAISTVGDSSFCETLISSLNWLVSANQVVIISYKPGHAPLFLFDNVKRKEKDKVIASYSAGAFLLDPWYEAAKSGIADGTYRLSDVAPDEFICSDFYRIYYRDTSLKDEVNYIFTLAGGAVIEISLGRLDKLFTVDEYHLLKQVETVVLAMCKKHWSGSGESDLATYGGEGLTETHKQVVNVLNNFGVSILTERERELAVLMLRGHSLKSCAATLDIAMGTVKVHCKNLYSKLEIGSISELFSLFIEVLACPESINSSDPLKDYLEAYQ